MRNQLTTYIRRVTAAGAILIATGCNMQGFSTAPRATLTGQEAAQALIGQWSLTLRNNDNNGTLVSSAEARWEFNADGTARRMTISRQHASGSEEVALDVAGKWASDGSTVQLLLSPPNEGGAQLPYRIERLVDHDELVIESLRFTRVHG